jgi:hypothetical protein
MPSSEQIDCVNCVHSSYSHATLTLDGLTICRECAGSYQCHKLDEEWPPGREQPARAFGPLRPAKDI